MMSWCRRQRVLHKRDSWAKEASLLSTGASLRIPPPDRWPSKGSSSNSRMVSGRSPSILRSIEVISRVSQRYLVEFLGWCKDANNLMLVYELVPGGNLHEHLHEGKSWLSSWSTRYVTTGNRKCITSMLTCANSTDLVFAYSTTWIFLKFGYPFYK